MKNRLMFIDTETGGINPQKHSLLSIGIVIWDSLIGEIFSAEYFLKHERYVVTKTALNINHFLEERHNDEAIEPLEAVKKICSLKEKFFEEYPSIPLAGHNTQFDSQFLKRLFESCGRSYEKTFSHRLVDTYSILKFMSDSKIIQEDVQSSAKAFKYFNINVDGRHTAIGDARATMELYEKLIKLVSLKNDSASII